MKCPDGCGLTVPEFSAKPEKVLYKIDNGRASVTCDGAKHYMNADKGRRLELYECDCDLYDYERSSTETA